MMKIKTLLLSSIFLSASLQAGIQGVGNGGGFGEMQAYYADHLWVDLFELCSANHNPCGFENSKWLQVKSVNYSFENFGSFHINPKCSSPFLRLKDGELEMDSCLFYMSEKDSWGFLPKPKSEIAALVLKARLHQIGSEHMDSLIEMMMPLVNAEATIQIQTYASTGRGLPWRIQWVQQHTPLGERNFVALESLTQSTDITESFFEAVSCAQEDFRLIQWTKPQFLMAEARSSWAKSQLIWHCENEKFRAEVYMGLQAVDNDQLHSQVMLRQLEQL